MKEETREEFLMEIETKKGIPNDSPPVQVEAGTVNQPPSPGQLSVQDGKESLPPPPPSEQVDFDEYEQDYDGDQQEPVFTDQDRKDLPELEGKVKQHGLEEAKALKEIRTRKLWMTLRDKDGSRLYKNFGEYCAERLGHEKQWVTQKTNWLARNEMLANLRAQGHDVPEFINATVANSLPYLIECAEPGTFSGDAEEAGLLAVIKEAVAEGIKLTATNSDALRVICHRRGGYYGAITSKPAAPSYEQYKADLEMLTEIAVMPTDYNTPGKVLREKEDSGCSYAEAAEKVYIKEGCRPADAHILHNATSNELRNVIDRLLAAQAKREAVEKAKEDYAEANRKKKEAKAAKDQALQAAGLGKPEQEPKEPDNDVEVEHRYELVINEPVNPGTFALPSVKGCVEKIDKLLEAAIQQTPKPGDEYSLSVKITVKAVAVEVEIQDEDEEEEQEEPRLNLITDQE